MIVEDRDDRDLAPVGQHPLGAVHLPASVVVASEKLDGEEGWRMIDAGELLHVGRDLTVTTTLVLPEAPARTTGLPADNPNDDS